MDADDPFLATMQPYLRKEYDMCHVTLGEVLAAKGEKMKFEYDFGDSWIHQVSLSCISSVPDAPLSIRVISGKGPCPPEDCGGVWGYAELLGNPTGELARHHAFDPTATFDLEEANFFMQEYLGGVEEGKCGEDSKI